MQDERDDLFDDDVDFKVSSNNIATSEHPAPVSRRSIADEGDVQFDENSRMILDKMENTQACIFLTGDAGTGKSTLVNHFVKHTSKKVITLAPTGVAAVNVKGQTIHSFFRFPPKAITRHDIAPLHFLAIQLLRSIDAFIIDEISMVRADMLDAINLSLQINLKSKEPFAGKQIIMVGDLNQLPPVIANKAEREMIQDNYDSPYFFSAKVLKTVEFAKYRLTKVYRQTDQNFIDLLNKIKSNTATKDDLNLLNSNSFKPIDIKTTDYITLCSTNAVADNINQMRLDSIDGEEFMLEGVFESYTGSQFNDSELPAEKIIRVKKGCKIMMLNNDMQKRWHNGTTGKLVDLDLDRNILKIEIGDNIYDVDRLEYDKVKHVYNQKEKKIETQTLCLFRQWPIRLCYAITIHKSQGKTFDKLNIDMGTGAFAHGQAYVALSRCRTMNGIALARPISTGDIIYDRKVFDFLNSIQ